MTLYDRTSQSLIQMMESRLALMDKRLNALGVTTAQAAALGTTTFGSIQNLIDNGEQEFSKDAYINTPLAGGDIGFEAYNWYRQTTATTLLAESAANALKYTGHSLYAANEGANADIPRWERVSGWGEVGSVGGTNYDIACPLPINFIQGGMSFVIQFIHKMRTATAWPTGLEVAAMFYDNTAGQEKIIEGSAFALSYAIGGAAGATALEYKIIGQTDYGEEIESNVLPVPDAPTTLTPSNYVGLSWAGAPGYINFSIYKKVGATYYLQFVVTNGGTSYRDQGDAPLATVGGYPSISATRAKAYVETQGFAPSFSTWQALDPQVIIRIPTTYNIALTTGRQWLRLRINGATTDAQQLLIDRIGVSTGFGGWARSANDLQAAARNPSTSTSTWEQGNIGLILCPSVDTLVDAFVDGDRVKIKAGDLRKRDKLVSREGTVTVTGNRAIWCDKMVQVTTQSGKVLKCSESHPLIRGHADVQGLAVSKFRVGRTVQTVDDEEDEIVSIENTEPGMASDLSVTAPHIYVTNGIYSHNLKFQD